MGKIDLQPPRKIGRGAEQLLVEPVAPPTNRLCNGQSRRDRVSERRHHKPASTHTDVRTDAAEGDRAPDSETALPDLERVDRVATVAEVRIRRRDDVVEPAADDAKRNGPDRDIHHRAAGSTTGAPASFPDPDRQRDSDDHRQRVAPDGEDAQVPDPLAGTGNGKHAEGQLPLADSIAAWRSSAG